MKGIGMACACEASVQLVCQVLPASRLGLSEPSRGNHGNRCSAARSRRWGWVRGGHFQDALLRPATLLRPAARCGRRGAPSASLGSSGLRAGWSHSCCPVPGRFALLAIGWAPRALQSACGSRGWQMRCTLTGVGSGGLNQRKAGQARDANLSALFLGPRPHLQAEHGWGTLRSGQTLQWSLLWPALGSSAGERLASALGLGLQVLCPVAQPPGPRPSAAAFSPFTTEVRGHATPGLSFTHS